MTFTSEIAKSELGHLTYHDNKAPNSPVPEAGFDSLPLSNVSLCTLSVGKTIVSQSLGSEHSFLGAEPHGSRWVVRQDGPSPESNERSCDTLNEEEPSPSGKASSTVQVLGNDTGEKT